MRPMKTPLLLACALIATVVAPAKPYLVYGKGDSVEWKADGSTPVPADDARAAFLAAFTADLGHPKSYGPVLKLVDPLDLGRSVKGAHGYVQAHATFPGGLVIKVNVAGLTPNHRYVLTLHGKAQRTGYEQLPDPVPDNAGERYYDFFECTTGPGGGFNGIFGVKFPPGYYDFRFYVKDTDDHAVVLYRDYFKFTVE